MRLYNFKFAPNPKLVRMFIAEKGIDVPLIDVDIVKGENRKPPYIIYTNPAGYVPALETDDGTLISESTVICEYLEEKHPDPVLIGSTPEQRAETRMWTRRVDLEIMIYMAQGFRGAEGQEMFKDRMRTYPQVADEMKKGAQDGIFWMNRMLLGKEYICGDRFSLADIALYAWLSFGHKNGQPFDDGLENIAAWFERIGARDSASA